MPQLSVVIPTYRRPDILAECLRRLERQTVSELLEVIVVSDGPDAKTAALFANRTWRMPVRFFEVPKSHQGVARNEGVRHAQSPYTLFIGDDIFLEHDACEWHLQMLTSGRWMTMSSSRSSGITDHRPVDDRVAILGFTTWDPDLSITPVMRWLEASGWQFGYPMIRKYAHSTLPPNLQHRFTYTSHISLPTRLALAHPFQTDVHLYGWEDIEWGARLRDAGARLYYEPHAKALHHHRITMDESLRRMEILGRSAKQIAAKSPEFDRVPKGWKLFGYRIAALFPTMAGRHRKAFLTGVKNG